MKEEMESLATLAVAILFATLLLANGWSAYASRSERPGAPDSARTLYDAKCAKCHGSNGRGRTLRGKLDHARDFTDAGWQNDVSDERLFNSINNGRGKMPSFKRKLTEQQIDDLVTYVRHFKS
jgi:cytochrome c6